MIPPLNPRKLQTSVGSERLDMKTIASWIGVLGLFVGLGSFLMVSPGNLHIALVGLLLIAFGIFVHVDRKA